LKTPSTSCSAATDNQGPRSLPVDEVLAAEVPHRYWQRWNEENQVAIDAYNERIAGEGLPLAKYRSFGAF
jgi:post-segregation antitoxin (ccd killing protein)